MANKEISESGLTFEFRDVNDAIKFDDTDIYRNEFNMLPDSKGVDIIADSNSFIQLIEIKNCKGHESENMWRMGIDNSKIKSAPHDIDVTNRDSLDIEVSKKAAMTIACLMGARSRQSSTEKANVLKFAWEGILSEKLLKDKKKLLVILFLEGDFANKAQTRTKKMMMKRLEDSIKKKLTWLNCQVSVVDTDTYKQTCFSVR